jgi:hypothetical protein
MLAGLIISVATLMTMQASAAPSGAVNLAAGQARQVCTENSGGSIDLRNDRGGRALITYRSIFGYFQNGR